MGKDENLKGNNLENEEFIETVPEGVIAEEIDETIEIAQAEETISKEQVTEVKLSEETILEENKFLREEEIKVEGKGFYYIKIILSGIIDQILAIGLALILFFVFSLILKLFGYKIVMREEMFTIMYILINVLYYPTIQEILHGKTLGRKFLFR